jgi:hypothetical protein
VTAIEGLSIRPYLDNDVHLWIATDLRNRGFDAVHSLEIGHEGFSDEEHLRWAAHEGRTVVTFDREDFKRLSDDWRRRGESHAGIIVSVAPPRIALSAFHRRLLAFLDAVAADDMANMIRWLDDP